MSLRPYRGFRKAYGGDPDRAIVQDLHKRLMKVEIELDRLRSTNMDLQDAHATVLQRLKYVLVAAGGTVGGDPPPPRD